MALPLLLPSLLLLSSWAVYRLSQIGKRESFLPPGPPCIPLFGNLHVFPTEDAHYKFTEWAKDYGHIYSLKIGPATAIVISSASAVRELMDKRSGSTADRPPNHIADAATGGLNMVLARYGEVWRILRKTAHAILTPQASEQHLPIQNAEAAQLMYDILNDPERFYTHIRRYSNSVIMSVLYGKRSPRYESKASVSFFEAQHLWEQALRPGAHPPVDLIPALNYIPERWAPWRTACKEIRKRQRELYFGLYEECEKRIARGEENGCYMETVIQKREEFGMNREMAGYLGGVLIEGGSDTTSSFTQSLVLALVSFPEVTRKAQEEIDRVIGTHRLPTMEDFEHLPYIRAIVQETHRWRPVAPLMIPHASTSEEKYEGYLIPEGTTIFVNTWGIFHDPEAFDNPEAFHPERYLLTEYGTKPGYDDGDFRNNLAFGCGRRICPGIHIATNSLIRNTMNLIWAFNFDLAKDPETKEPIPVDVWDFEKGILTGPRPFKCNISVRNKEKAEMINREFHEAIETFEKFEDGLDEADKEWIARHRKL